MRNAISIGTLEIRFAVFVVGIFLFCSDQNTDKITGLDDNQCLLWLPLLFS